MGRLLLLEHMGFHLVHGGGHLHKLAQIDEPVWVEIGHPNGPQLPGLVRLLHGPVGAVVVAEGLVNQQQVDVIGLQVLQGLVNGGLGLLVALVGNPHLGGEEQLVPGHAALDNSAAHRVLVAVGLGRVDGAVSHADGVQHAAFALLVFYLIDAVAQLGHLHAVI